MSDVSCVDCVVLTPGLQNEKKKNFKSRILSTFVLSLLVNDMNGVTLLQSNTQYKQNTFCDQRCLTVKLLLTNKNVINLNTYYILIVKGKSTLGGLLFCLVRVFGEIMLTINFEEFCTSGYGINGSDWFLIAANFMQCVRTSQKSEDKSVRLYAGIIIFW